jgi:hypothetical protein
MHVFNNFSLSSPCNEKWFRKESLEEIKTHLLCSITFFSNHTVYEAMWNNINEQGRLQMKIRRLRFACWIIKTANTHSEYVIVITFPLQQWLQESAP